TWILALCLSAACLAEEGCGVEIGEFVLARTRIEKRVSADLLVKNVAGRDLAEVSVVLILLEDGKEVARSAATLKDAIPAGRSCRLEAAADEAPRFTSYRLIVTYVDEGPHEFAFVGVSPEAAPVLEGAAAEAPPEGGTPPSGGKSKAATIGLAGLRVIDGVWVGEGKKRRYTGDVYFLQIAFRDAEGKPVNQAGTVEVFARQGKKTVANVRRAVQEGHYKLEASKLDAKTASPEVVCFDAEAGVVLVGVLRWNANDKFAAQIDVAFRSAEGDRWLWKALEDPWSEDPRGPEPR
ncbi:MAG: hypothetical protein AAB434_08220, partial [Planctomycetota bacterium]